MAAVAKDPAIKLFGRTISLPETQFSDESDSLDNGSSLMAKAETEECRNENSLMVDEIVSIECCKGEQLEKSMKQPITSQETIKPKGHQEDSDGAGEAKQMRRPDKIVPCPRCNSSDTKFCYFNNYNVNQPRHFCKSCQRYWTAGGTVRNVPVGAGRRRNKHLASQYRQVIASSDGGLTMMDDTLDSANQLLACEESSSSCTGSSPNEMVLKFGSELPHCDNSTQNLLNGRQSNGCSDMGSSLTCSSFGMRGINSDVSSQQHLYHYVVPPHTNASTGPHSNVSVSIPVPGYATPNIPYQIVPGAYMNCIPVWVAGSGNIALAVPNNGCVSSPFLSNGNRLQVLGKHSRNTNPAQEGRIEQGISAPKALKIQELDEA